jgi:hypothetical protein
MYSLERIRSELLRLKWHVAALRFERAMQRHALALKAGFNPDQPRDELGRWTDAGGEGFETDDGDSEGFDKSEDRYSTDISAVRRRPGIGHNQGPPINDPSDIPPERPDVTWIRNRIAQAIARNPVLVSYYFAVIATSPHWLNEMYWNIKANQDPPKTLDELHDARLVSDKRGYEDHHVVLRAAQGPGITEARIKGSDNIVRIPRYKHWELNRWYETPNREFGELRPREYLKGKSWEENRSLGLRALRDIGVLKP